MGNALDVVKRGILQGIAQMEERKAIILTRNQNLGHPHRGRKEGEESLGVLQDLDPLIILVEVNQVEVEAIDFIIKYAF